MYINEDHILIRDFKENDIKNKIEWINDPRNNTFLHYDIPLNYKDTLNWYKTKDKSKRIDCIIEYDSIPVGLIGLLQIDRINMKAELYITIGNADYKRRGIAFKSINLVLKYGFSELNLNKVYLNVDAENTAACRLYEKVGLEQEGFFVYDLLHNNKLIDRKRYAIIRQNFSERNL